MDGIEHGVDVQAAQATVTIRWQRGQVEVGEDASTKLVEEVGNFHGEVAHQCPPSPATSTPPNRYCFSTASKMMSDFTPAPRSGPDIAADAEAAALIRVLGLLANVEPPPVRSQRHFPRFTRLVCQMLPVVVFVALIFIVHSDSCCTLKVSWAVM